jgi:hypothetical protein
MLPTRRRGRWRTGRRGSAVSKRHSYLRIDEAIEHTKSLPRAKPLKKHSYIREALVQSILSDDIEPLSVPPFLRLVPQPLEALPKHEHDNAAPFETDPDEARRVTLLLAVLFARTAAQEPMSHTVRATLGITEHDIYAIAQRVGRARAAEIMGLMWAADGSLVDDPNAAHAITTTTENQVNAAVDAAVVAAAGFQGTDTPVDESGFPATWAPGQGPNDIQPADTSEADLTLAIGGLFAFSASRPDVVADMETGVLQNLLALDAYGAAGVTQVLVHDGEEWDEECAAVDGMTWPIDRALANLKQHPWCVRWFEPIL